MARRLRLTALALLAALLAPLATAAEFPELSGRVVDQADLLPPADEAALAAQLAGLETRTGRQLVVATVTDLGGRDIADYGVRLGRAWAIGEKDVNSGVIFLIAPNDRRMRIEVGNGLEPVLTDALAGRIIRDQVTPAFRAGDFVGGITAGTEAIISQLELPEAEAKARAAAASDDEGSAPPIAVIFWIIVIVVVVIIIAANSGGGGGRKYRSKQRGGTGPVIIWGGGGGGGSSGWGWGSGGGSSWGGGGFSGGGGSFGGGGASGGW